jgi:RNA polymerase sigma factor for flagellar operon FliA
MNTNNPYEQHIQEAQNNLAIQYLPAVKGMAYRLKERLPSSIDVSELISIGAEEIIKLARRYNESLNDSFWGYAKKRVYGAMLDYLRSLDIVSRTDRKILKDMEKKILEYIALYDEEPSDEYLSKELNEDIEKIKKVRYTTEIYTLMPLDEQIQAFNQASTEATVEQDEIIEIIKDILVSMGEREQLVIQLYYFEELNLKEISHILNITESRISQIIKTTIRKIRERAT